MCTTKAEFKQRYRVGKLLCRGGQAYIRQGVHVATGQAVALKIYKKVFMTARDYSLVK